jgi:predicted Zn-dependent peptidase
MTVFGTYSPENGGSGVAASLNALDTLVTGKVDEPELRIAKESMTSAWRESTACLSGAASIYATATALGAVEYARDFPARVNGVLSADVTRVARAYLSKELRVVFFGDDRWVRAEELQMGKPVPA